MYIVKLKFLAVALLGIGLVVGDNAKAVALAAAADGEEKVTVEKMPPVVVRTVPQAGDTEVDADKVKEIRVTFSKRMRDGSWSPSQISNETFPKTAGDLHYDKERRTFIMPVKLEAGKTYVLWLNSARFKGFQDADGRPAVPYLLAFRTKAEQLGAEALGRAFDALWNDMDRNYSYFALKKVDWMSLKERYRPKAVAAGDLPAFVEVLSEMLGHLRDGHVWIDCEGRIPTHISRTDGNYNREVVEAALKRPTHCGDLAFVGVTKTDGFGALVLIKQSKADKESVRQVVEFIRAHSDAPGFLVDLREANGGNELLARELAREFCGKDVVYAKSKYRAGRGHDDFGPIYDRILKASDKPYTKPVVCLIGPRAVSSGEGFVQMMKCLPHVTTVGARTRGSSGNPKPLALPGMAVTVWYSRWVDLMPDGKAVEGAGIAPDIAVDAPRDVYKKKDPTWEKAVEVLRKKASPGPGKGLSKNKSQV